MKKRGFTLIEMLIVIVIIGILAGALIPRIGSARDKANDTAREANVRSLATALVSYGLDHGEYPEDDEFEEGLLDNYSIPHDLFNNQPAGTEYHYRQLDDGTHFVVYAQLSDNSDAGNCEASNTPASCTNKKQEWKDDDVDTQIAANCEEGFQEGSAVGVASADASFEAINPLIRNHGGSFCYVQ